MRLLFAPDGTGSEHAGTQADAGGDVRVSESRGLGPCIVRAQHGSSQVTSAAGVDIALRWKLKRSTRGRCNGPYHQRVRVARLLRLGLWTRRVLPQ